MSRSLIVAIDGPSASGKTTLGRMLARHLRLPLVDTGLMYRAVTVLAREGGIDPGDEDALGRIAATTPIEVNTTTADGRHWEVRAAGTDLTGKVFDPQLAPVLTRVSQAGPVRRALVDRQRTYGAAGVVMVGRDIGTVVFPEADLKLFITASDAERRRRRARQRSEVDQGLMRGEISDRDAADAGRSLSPLRVAPDAYTIDTDDRSPDQVFEEVLRLIPASRG
ncbi:MAG: (d)CMP kinase [Candidatus Dormibacteraeota bacterium]|nr:(d)CMP kinase [Candidatus Dormibacteraeota bacterium]